MLLADLRQAHACRRMRMNDGSDIRFRRIHSSVNPMLAVGLAVAMDDLAVEVDRQQPILVGEPRRASRRQQERVGARNPRARMAERVRQSEPLEYPVGEGDVASQCGDVRHRWSSGYFLKLDGIFTLTSSDDEASAAASPLFP